MTDESAAQHTTEHLTRARLVRQAEGMAVLALPGSEYQLHLAISAPLEPGVNQSVVGRVHARARRVDRMKAGGRFMEPVYGRPRTIQGTVVATDAGANTLTVQCGCPIVCELQAPQRADAFTAGELVGFHIERGANFDQVTAPAQTATVGSRSATVEAGSPGRADTTPPGHEPTEGDQQSLEQARPDKTHDAGALGQERITGRTAPTGETALDGKA